MSECEIIDLDNNTNEKSEEELPMDIKPKKKRNIKPETREKLLKALEKGRSVAKANREKKKKVLSKMEEEEEYNSDDYYSEEPTEKRGKSRYRELTPSPPKREKHRKKYYDDYDKYDDYSSSEDDGWQSPVRRPVRGRPPKTSAKIRKPQMKKISEKDKRLRWVEEQVQDIVENLKKVPRTKTVNKKQTIIQMPKDDKPIKMQNEDEKMLKKATGLLNLF